MIEPKVYLYSQYIINDYGFAIVNETMTFKNDGISSIEIPAVQLSFPSQIAMKTIGDAYLSGGGFKISSSNLNGSLVISVNPSQSVLAPNSSTSFSLKFVVKDIVTVKGTSMNVTVLSYPSINLSLRNVTSVIFMPQSTYLSPIPPGYKSYSSGSRSGYILNLTDVRNITGKVIDAKVQSGSPNLHPIHVYRVIRTISISQSGTPQVTDTITLKNMGTSEISTLKLNLLTTSSSVVAVPSSYPPLVNPTRVTLNSGQIDIANDLKTSIRGGENFTISLLYDLPAKFYSVWRGNVNVTVPLNAPIQAPLDEYVVKLDLPPGFRQLSAGYYSFTRVTPISQGSLSFSYSISPGWASDRAIPVATIIFLIAFVGLYLAKRKEAEAKDQVGIPSVVSDMVKAFEDKIELVGSMLDNIKNEDPNSLNKAYFDELRRRLDNFRSRALQRLNEAKQKATTRSFYDLLNHIHDVEREADRAAKDMISLYEQYYTRRMRKETFDRLLPSYRKRLNDAIDKLSDQLNTAQKESKIV